MTKDSTIVVLRSLRLTKHLFFQEIAQLDKGLNFNDGDELPKGKYCIYYRIVMNDGGVSGNLTDYSGEGVVLTFDELAKFYGNNK
jgi:hypothetical protein